MGGQSRPLLDELVLNAVLHIQWHAIKLFTGVLRFGADNYTEQ